MGNKELFYSGKEKILFWITDCVKNPVSANNAIESIRLGVTELISDLPIKETEVEILYLEHSPRYKNRRVFYVKTEHVPKNVYFISKQLTMIEWLFS